MVIKELRKDDKCIFLLVVGVDSLGGGEGGVALVHGVDHAAGQGGE